MSPGELRRPVAQPSDRRTPAVVRYSRVHPAEGLCALAVRCNRARSIVSRSKNLLCRGAAIVPGLP